MKHFQTSFFSLLLCFCFLFSNSFYAYAASTTPPPPSNVSETGDISLELTAASAVLMEATTGTVLYEKNATQSLPPASITKIMTLLLIFDALESGQIHLEDQVTVSEYAASMGGSQVFLEPGETQTVDTMMKCIAVSSANDACVAMSEFICGNEETFVAKMNERAKGLHMTSTHFVNCNGLDTDNHVTSALDVALMSRELISKYPEVSNYSTIWMDTIIHSTKKGDSEFGLANTNKFLKMYEYATGLKTGSTSNAKFCVSATAMKDEIPLIAVIMGAPDSKVRFQEAVTLLNYGYEKCKLYSDENTDTLSPVPVTFGVENSVSCKYQSSFQYLDTSGADLNNIEKEIIMKEVHQAPITKGDIAGKAIYKLNGKEIGNVPILYSASIKKMQFSDCFKKIFQQYKLGKSKT
ncbi:MAG: D-alanyl-D-alanine carboxypeptidase [Lachnospiraceae bacterium]|nr:D-alanyl-D-alanine carboxypeptidase [Lachnospiraceae bacterium]